MLICLFAYPEWAEQINGAGMKQARKYPIGIPNQEVRVGLTEHLLPLYTGRTIEEWRIKLE